MADLKTLRVCLSSELPPISERSKNFIYFTYDKLFLYSGQDRLNVNYAIASELPAIDDQVEGMFYILNTDGTVHRKANYQDYVIANIESAGQIPLLRRAGTMFYVNADHRYLDSQTRSMTLPWNDGAYELNVSTKKDMVYDENTILKFNPDTNRFEVYGDSTEEFIDFSKPFRGSETNTAKITVDGPRLSADLKISKVAGNIIKLIDDGLFINGDNFAKARDFADYYQYFTEFARNTEESLDFIKEQLDEVMALITPEYINAEIYSILQSRFPTIRTAIDNYAAFVRRLAEIEDEVIQYMVTATSNTIEVVNNTVETNSSWENLDDAASTYTPEIDYFAKSAEVTMSNPSGDDLEALLNAAVAAYIDAENNETD